MIQSEYFPTPSAHKQYVLNRIPRGAHYDPADDGPEVNIINRILFNNPINDPKGPVRKVVMDFVEAYAEEVCLKLRYIEVAREALKG